MAWPVALGCFGAFYDEVAAVPPDSLTLWDCVGAEEALSFKVSFDFALYFWDGDGTLQGVLAYDGALSTQDTARAMMARFERFVTSGTHAPQVPPAEALAPRRGDLVEHEQRVGPPPRVLAARPGPKARNRTTPTSSHSAIPSMEKEYH